jgi:hypothetical protein
MGRGLEVRRESENLPVVNHNLMVFSRNGTLNGFPIFNWKSAIENWQLSYEPSFPFVGTTAFLLRIVPSRIGAKPIIFFFTEGDGYEKVCMFDDCIGD